MDVLESFGEYEYSLLIIAVCHMISLIPIVNSLRNADMRNITVVSIATIVTSVCYHYTEVCHCQVLGIGDGKWHRLDNIFIICTVQMYLIYLLMGNKANKSERSPFEFLSLSITIVCQEIAPWDVRFTILPIVVTMLIVAVYCRGALQTPARIRGLHVLMIGVPTIYCFHMGLDDEKDYLRLYHYGWHVGASLMANLVLPPPSPSKRHLL